MEDRKTVVPVEVEPGLSISKAVEATCYSLTQYIVRWWSPSIYRRSRVENGFGPEQKGRQKVWKMNTRFWMEKNVELL
jgi:hypothetical protein